MYLNCWPKDTEVLILFIAQAKPIVYNIDFLHK